jgi:hypothetical protein
VVAGDDHSNRPQQKAVANGHSGGTSGGTSGGANRDTSGDISGGTSAGMSEDLLLMSGHCEYPELLDAVPPCLVLFTHSTFTTMK